MEVTLHDIVNVLTKARAEAERSAEGFPQYQQAFLRFSEDVSRAQKELILKIRPELFETENGLPPADKKSS